MLKIERTSSKGINEKWEYMPTSGIFRGDIPGDATNCGYPLLFPGRDILLGQAWVFIAGEEFSETPRFGKRFNDRSGERFHINKLVKICSLASYSKGSSLLI